MMRVSKNRIFQLQVLSFWLIIFSIIALLLSYVFFTAFSILNVAERERLEGDVLDTRGEAVALELQFIEKEGSITLERAKNIGFTEVNPRFVSRKSSVVRVTLNNEN